MEEGLGYPKLREKIVTVENNDESLVLTPKEVQKLLSCSRGVVYYALAAGIIPCRRISPRKIIIPKHAFFKWLDEGGGNDLHS